MHFPLYIKLFGLSIHPHFLFESLGYSVGFLVFRLLRRKSGDVISQSVRWSVIAAATFGAALGSKLFYWLEDPHRIIAHWNDFQRSCAPQKLERSSLPTETVTPSPLLFLATEEKEGELSSGEKSFTKLLAITSPARM